MSADATHLLNDLLEAARDGERFYLDAADKVRSEYLRTVFREMAEGRRRLIMDLNDNVLARGETPSASPTVTGAARKLYTDALSRMLKDNEVLFVTQLEHVEEQLLVQYRKALAEAPAEDVRKVLQRHLLSVEAAHEKMQALKERLETA